MSIYKVFTKICEHFVKLSKHVCLQSAILNEQIKNLIVLQLFIPALLG